MTLAIFYCRLWIIGKLFPVIFGVFRENKYPIIIHMIIPAIRLYFMKSIFSVKIVVFAFGQDLNFLGACLFV